MLEVKREWSPTHHNEPQGAKGPPEAYKVLSGPQKLSNTFRGTHYWAWWSFRGKQPLSPSSTLGPNDVSLKPQPKPLLLQEAFFLVFPEPGFRSNSSASDPLQLTVPSLILLFIIYIFNIKKYINIKIYKILIIYNYLLLPFYIMSNIFNIKNFGGLG